MESERGKQILCQKISRDKRSNKKEATKLFNECEFAIVNRRPGLLESAKHLLRGILLESSKLHAEIIKTEDIEKIQESKNWLNEINEQGRVWLERGIEKETAEMSEVEGTELDRQSRNEFERDKFLKNTKNSKLEKMSTKSMPTKICAGKFGYDQNFQKDAKNFPVDTRKNQTSEKRTDLLENKSVKSKKSERTYRDDASVNSRLTQKNLERHDFGTQKSGK